MQQFIHQLNNTEIGKTLTHETYVSISRGIAPRLSSFLPLQPRVEYKRTGMHYDLVFRRVANGEYRLTGLGRLYQEANPEAGDLIVIEERNGQFFIDFVYQKNVIVFSHSIGDCFECRNEERLSSIPGPTSCFFNNDHHILQVENAGSRQPRKDSPRIVNLFKLIMDGNAIQGIKGKILNLFVYKKEKETILVTAYPDSIRSMEQA